MRIKRTFALAVAVVFAVVAFAAVALADGFVRTVVALPAEARGTNAVVYAHFQKDKAVEIVAFDVIGTSAGTVEAYVVRKEGGVVATNAIASAAAVAATNAVGPIGIRSYLYGGENASFRFSNAGGGALVVYGKAKE